MGGYEGKVGQEDRGEGVRRVREDIGRERGENANMRVEQGWEAMKEKSGKKTGEGACGEREKI